MFKNVHFELLCVNLNLLHPKWVGNTSCCVHSNFSLFVFAEFPSRCANELKIYSGYNVNIEEYTQFNLLSDWPRSSPGILSNRKLRLSLKFTFSLLDNDRNLQFVEIQSGLHYFIITESNPLPLQSMQEEGFIRIDEIFLYIVGILLCRSVRKTSLHSFV